MRVAIDQNLCGAQGRCYTSFPELFKRGPGGKGESRQAEFADDGDVSLELQAAANLCPRGAIRVEE